MKITPITILFALRNVMLFVGVCYGTFALLSAVFA